LSLFNELKRRNVFKVTIAYIVMAWLVMQVADVILNNIVAPGWVFHVLLMFLAIGLPFAVFFAWAFELTPEGLKREHEVDRFQSITHKTGRKLDFMIIGVMAVALGYFVYDKFLVQTLDVDDSSSVASDTGEPPGDAYQTIAVLPFVNMSEDTGNEYFSDGLTEELLNILTKIKNLRVAGRTSSFAFKGKHDDLRIIGEKLNVGSILEGSVRKDAKRNLVRITVQLINVDDGYHLWSETYDRELDDIFAIQDEIARAVAQALRITLLGEDEVRLEQVASTKINAYDLYLQALQGLNDGGYASLEKATDQFKQALAMDPAFTPAKLGLVNAWSELAITGSITRQEALSQGVPLLEEVLEKQPGNSDARIQMAQFHDFEDDQEAAEKAFITALETDPRNARGLQEFGKFLFDNGQVARGMELIDAALVIEPYAIRVLWHHCQTNALLQNVDAALSSCARIREIAPESPLGWYGWANVHSNTGDIARTAKGFFDAIERDPGDYEMLAAMSGWWVLLGDVEQARVWQQRADAIGADQPIPIWSRLKLYKFREQHDLARDLAGQTLERKIEDRWGTNILFRQTWAFESARIGNYLAALNPYREAFPWAFLTPLEVPDDSRDQIWDIIQIAGLLKLAEPMSGRPEQLLDIVAGNVDQQNPRWGAWNPDLTRAAVATIRGEREVAMNWLNSAWDKKWRDGWREQLLDDAIFTQLAGEPGYKELVARFEADMERQREEAYVLMGISK
jgi:TolB-like protein